MSIWGVLQLDRSVKEGLISSIKAEVWDRPDSANCSTKGRLNFKVMLISIVGAIRGLGPGARGLKKEMRALAPPIGPLELSKGFTPRKVISWVIGCIDIPPVLAVSKFLYLRHSSTNEDLKAA